jgi:hypothetical protein
MKLMNFLIALIISLALTTPLPAAMFDIAPQVDTGKRKRAPVASAWSDAEESEAFTAPDTSEEETAESEADAMLSSEDSATSADTSEEAADSEETNDESMGVSAAPAELSIITAGREKFGDIEYSVTLYCAERLKLFNAREATEKKQLLKKHKPQLQARDDIRKRFEAFALIPAGQPAELNPKYANFTDYSLTDATLKPLPAKKYHTNDYRFTHAVQKWIKKHTAKKLSKKNKVVAKAIEKIDLHHVMAPWLDQYILNESFIEEIDEANSIGIKMLQLVCNLIVTLTVDAHDGTPPKTVCGCMQYMFYPKKSHAKIGNEYHHRCFKPFYRLDESSKIHRFIIKGIRSKKITWATVPTRLQKHKTFGKSLKKRRLILG